jgi:hypothetical protein
VIPPRPGCGVEPDSCTDYPLRHCLCFQLIANDAGGGYLVADRSVPLLVFAELRHLPREAIATGIQRFSLLKPSTTPATMTQKAKLESIFHLSSEQLETRVNLTATAPGVDRYLSVLAPHVSQVKVAPHKYSVVMPQVKAAVAKTVTIPAVGQSGTFQWNWQADRTLSVQLGNLRGTFRSVNQDGWNGEFSYKAKLPGGTSLTHTFRMTFRHDRDAKESTLTYDDATNHLRTTFDEAAAVSTMASGASIQRVHGTVKTSSVSGTSIVTARVGCPPGDTCAPPEATTASGTSIQRPNRTVETSSVIGSTVVGTFGYTGAPQYAGVPPVTVKGSKAWQETSNADGSTTVASTKPRTLGTTLDEVKALITGLKVSLENSFRTVAPTVYRPLQLSKAALPTPRVPLAVGWNAMRAVQTPEVKAGNSTALSTHLANQVQAMGTATRPQASLTITSFPYSYSFSKSQAGGQDGILLTVYYNGQLINSFTQASGDAGGLSYSGDNAPNMAGTQGQIVIYNASQIGTYVFNCNGSSSTQLTIHVTA